jgi:hypothetical protein
MELLLLLLEMRGMKVKACFDGICLKQIFSSFDVARHHVKIGQQPAHPYFNDYSTRAISSALGRLF